MAAEIPTVHPDVLITVNNKNEMLDNLTPYEFFRSRLMERIFMRNARKGRVVSLI